jgi:hypothetical protein
MTIDNDVPFNRFARRSVPSFAVRQLTPAVRRLRSPFTGFARRSTASLAVRCLRLPFGN